MPYNKTIGTLQTEIRAESEIPINYVDQPELMSWINMGIAELYDEILRASKDQYVEESSAITLSSGVGEYALPSDFYRIAGVDIEIGGKRYPMKKFLFSERNQYDDSPGDGWTLRYRYVGGELQIRPKPSGTHTVYVHYIPAPTEFATDGSDDSETFNFFAGWDQYVKLFCKIQFGMKDKLDVSVEEGRLERMRMRVISGGSALDEAEPDRWRDVAQEEFYSNFPWLVVD